MIGGGRDARGLATKVSPMQRALPASCDFGGGRFAFFGKLRGRCERDWLVIWEIPREAKNLVFCFVLIAGNVVAGNCTNSGDVCVSCSRSIRLHGSHRRSGPHSIVVTPTLLTLLSASCSPDRVVAP